MTWSLVLAVALGGAIGAPTRYLIDSRISRAAQQRGYGFFPWGLLVVNVIGSFIIGIAYGGGETHTDLRGPVQLSEGHEGSLQSIDDAQRGERTHFDGSVKLILGGQVHRDMVVSAISYGQVKIENLKGAEATQIQNLLE